MLLAMVLEDYLALDRATQWRFEYFDGQAHEVPPVPFRHCVLKTGLVGELREAAGRQSRQCIGAMRVEVKPRSCYLYPAAMIIADPYDGDPLLDQIATPLTIIELGEPACPLPDRLQLYRQNASVREYILVSPGAPAVQSFVRQSDDSWLAQTTTGLDSIHHFSALRIDLAIAGIYRDVTRLSIPA